MTIGILLAGGKSSRFEHGDKAFFIDPNTQKSWLELTHEKLMPLTEKTYILASPSNYFEVKKQFPQAFVLTDHLDFAGEGPLSGLYTVSKLLTKSSVKTDYLILAVDYPELTEEHLLQLLQKENCYVTHHFTLAHLRFNHKQIQTFLAADQRRFKDFLSLLNAQPIHLNSDLVNHNFH